MKLKNLLIAGLLLFFARTSSLGVLFNRVLTDLVNCAWSMFPSGGMVAHMLYAICEGKVFNTIVRLNSINMMDYFSRFEKSANLFFHHQAVFKNIAIGPFMWMVWRFNANISKIHCFASFPCSIFFSNKSSDEGFTYSKPHRFRNNFSFVPRNKAFFKMPIRFFHTAFIIALLLVSNQTDSGAADQWDKSSPLGTTQASDIDLNIGANNSSLDRLLSNYRQGAYPYSTGSVNGFSVSAGDLTISNSDGSSRRLRSNPTATPVTWSQMDSGPGDSVSTVYHVYAIADSATDATWTVKISTSSTAPATTTYYRRLGSFYNNSAGTIEIGGIIVMYSGFVSAIPPGYLLCDGTNGTPDLRDKFIFGAGGVASTNDSGGSAITGTGSSVSMITGTKGFDAQADGGSGPGATTSHSHTFMPAYYTLCFVQKIGVE